MWYLNKSTKIFFCLIILGLFGYSDGRRATADEPTTELYVRTVPGGAKVFLDGKEVGVTPGLFKAEPGTAKIVVKLEGCDPIEKEVEIHAARITRVELEFKGAQSAKAVESPESIRSIKPSDEPIAGSAKWENDELVVSSDAAASVRLFEVPISNRDQCIIIYRFRIKTDELKSGVYPEMWCRFPGKGEFFSRGLDQKLKGSNNWTSMQIPFYLKKGESPDLLKLNMVFEGSGAVRLKNIEILAAPLTNMMLAPQPIDPAAGLAEKVVEGVGWGPFKVGASREEIVKVAGEPEANPSPKNPWVWWRSRFHIDCLIDEQRGAFEVRFNDGFKFSLTSGVKIGSSEKEVLLAYGAPDRVVNKTQSKMLEYGDRGVLMWIMEGKVFQFTVFKPRKTEGEAANQTSPSSDAAAQPEAKGDNIIKNPGIETGNETPDDWEEGTMPEGLTAEGVTYTWDKKVAFKGNASLCIEKTAQNYMLPIAQWSQTVDRKGTQQFLMVSAQVKAQKVTKAILDVQFIDKDDNLISHEWVPTGFIGIQKKGQKPATHDWKKYSGKVRIPPNTAKLCIALQDYGPGKVWFDDINASYADTR